MSNCTTLEAAQAEIGNLTAMNATLVSRVEELETAGKSITEQASVVLFAILKPQIAAFVRSEAEKAVAETEDDYQSRKFEMAVEAIADRHFDRWIESPAFDDSVLEIINQNQPETSYENDEFSDAVQEVVRNMNFEVQIGR